MLICVKCQLAVVTVDNDRNVVKYTVLTRVAKYIDVDGGFFGNVLN
jgi:hypothetical protein